MRKTAITASTPSQVPNCAAAEQHARHRAGERADIGDEGEHPRHQPDRQAELEPDDLQPDGVDGAEDQAAEQLSAQPGAQHPVGVAGELAEHMRVAPRQPALDPADHARPVAQQVEADHRRHDDQGEDAEQRHAAADQPGEGIAEEGDDLPRLTDDEVAQLGVHEVRTQRFLRGFHRLADQRADANHIGRQPVDQDADLRDQQRVEQQQREQRGGRQRQDQQEGGQPPRHAEPREPRRHRIQEIGDATGEHEGREDRRKGPERKDQRRQPAQHDRPALALRRGARAGRGRPVRPAAARASWAAGRAGAAPPPRGLGVPAHAARRAACTT
jgi:hypothetical protein